MAGTIIIALCGGCSPQADQGPPATQPKAHVEETTATPRESEPLTASDSTTLTIVYDNNAPVAADAPSGLQTAWGFACLIETPKVTVLFDTGGDGPRLLGNMRALGIDPRDIDILVLSHEHSDHVGGVEALFAECSPEAAYVPSAFSAAIKSGLAAHTRVVEVDRPLEIAEGIRSTGPMGSTIIEQGLIVDTEVGPILITGCAHPGIAEMAEASTGFDGLALVLGGFHLKDTGDAGIGTVIDRLTDLGVRTVAPTHCTGDRGRAAFEEAFGDRYIAVGLGSTYTISR